MLQGARISWRRPLMLSVAPVGSASATANYYAMDDYYTVEGSSEISMWAGQGAGELGLSGEVSKAAFEGILNGVLPSGEAVAQVANRRFGFDLTFSMPKSASIMAYVAGDRRVLEANRMAVRKTMAWVETNLAQGRRDVEGRKVPVNTGNLVYALFQHDTSRALDPQGHVHAVIANLTRMPDGKWQALHADKIWSQNTVIGSVYHAELREGLEQLGYVVDLRGKHGTFEIAGVPASVLEEFSQRREQILDRANRLGIRSPEGLQAVAVRTRAAKHEVEDRQTLRQSWIERAASLGFDGHDLRLAAQARAGAALARGTLDRGQRAIAQVAEVARERLGALLRPHDPLVDHPLARAVRTAGEARTQLAVASAVRILSEREAAWPLHQLGKTALDLGLKGVTAGSVERRIGQLLDNRQLIAGTASAADRTGRMATTPEALRTEVAILDAVERGRGRPQPVTPAETALARLQTVAGHPLNSGQLAAATLILSSSDRTVTVQGVAGAGKSTMLAAVACIAEAEGRSVLGLAFQNKMVADLGQGAGIRAQTVASFVHAHERFIAGRATPELADARASLAGSLLIVDESSMVSSRDMLKLHQIAEALGIDKLVLVGDRQQLSSIDAGKAFAVIQAAGSTMARMDENLRQRTDRLRTVAALANIGKASAAMRVLGDQLVETAQPAMAAADMWLGLPTSERAATAVFASGREARSFINERIQEGLKAEGTIGSEALALTVHDRVNAAREELRYSSTYRAGQVLEVARGGAADIGLAGGRYRITRITKGGKVELSDGRRTLRFDPQKLSPTDQRDRLQLYEAKSLNLHEGDQIRWTANDKDRGLFNAALARVVGLDKTGVTVESGNTRLTLGLGDTMLARLDLAYALNMHMAQGITTDRAITVMSSLERQLSNQRLFNVAVTRVRDGITLVVDDRAKLERQLDRNPGDKTSALETLGRLDVDGPRGRDGSKEPDVKPDRGSVAIPLPEKGLSLDL